MSMPEAQSPLPGEAQILLIDDDARLGTVLTASLQDEPWRLTCALDAASGLAQAQRGGFDLILLDLGLPGEDGFSLLRQLKADPNLRHVPVLVLTAWDRTEDKLRGFELGAADYITKPFELAELRARLRSALRTKLLQDQLSRANRELEAARAAADAANRAKSEFLASMSHEIRTPMNALIATASLLKGTHLSAEQGELVEIVRLSGEALIAIINAILDLSKIEAGKMELELQPTDPRAIIREVSDLFAAEAGQKQIQISAQAQPEVPPTVLADPKRVRQVLTNLVSNALKFTQHGSVLVSLALRRELASLRAPAPPSPAPAHAVGSTPTPALHFTVRDTGIGIPADKLDRLFKPFSQADASVGQEYGGTGLGLAISAKLVQLMGGAIWVESTPGRGSAFHFTLPAQAPAALPTPATAPGGPAAAPAVAGPVPAAPAQLAQRLPLRVLLVDDNAINQKVGLRLLDKLGYQADLASNGLEAVEAARRRPYDLIIMDVQMPFMDGLEATRLIRAGTQAAPPGSPPAHRPSIVAVTAGVMGSERARCFEAGMDDYLAKPVRLEDLREMIERCAPRPQAPGGPAAAVAPVAAPPSTAPPLPTPETSRPQPEAETPPVDMERLQEFAGQDPQSMRELVGLYLQQTAEQLQKMEAVLAAGSAPDLRAAAHGCTGSSATCGMSAMVSLMRELERLAAEERLDAVPGLLEAARREFGRIEAFLTAHLKSLDSAASDR